MALARTQGPGGQQKTNAHVTTGKPGEWDKCKWEQGGGWQWETGACCWHEVAQALGFMMLVLVPFIGLPTRFALLRADSQRGGQVRLYIIFINTFYVCFPIELWTLGGSNCARLSSCPWRTGSAQGIFIVWMMKWPQYSASLGTYKIVRAWTSRTLRGEPVLPSKRIS